MHAILVGQDHLVAAQAPIDAEIRIVPRKTKLGGRSPIVGDFVENLARRLQHRIAVRKAFGDP